MEDQDYEAVDHAAENELYELCMGDARRCPRHPHVKTSSDDGMFDAPCGACEYEGDLYYMRLDAAGEAFAYALAGVEPSVVIVEERPVVEDDGLLF